MKFSPEEAVFQKRSFSLKGHKTSVSLEKAFWKVLEEICEIRRISLTQLVNEVDSTRRGGLASALRLYGLAYVKST